MEFARISSGNRVTLVIENGFDPVRILYAVSSFSELVAARANLRRRESTENIENIGYIDFDTDRHNVRGINTFILETIRAWNMENGFDAMIWSDFAPNFSDRQKQLFEVGNIISFIDALPKVKRTVL